MNDYPNPISLINPGNPYDVVSLAEAIAHDGRPKLVAFYVSAAEPDRVRAWAVSGGDVTIQRDRFGNVSAVERFPCVDADDLGLIVRRVRNTLDRMLSR